MKLSSSCLMGYISIFFLKAIFSEEDTSEEWTFSFPESISVLKNSDVTIPCTFTAPVNHEEVHLIWYKYQTIRYPQIFNSRDPSGVISEYKGRTALVSNRTGDCTLKIKDVTQTEKFYPGINEKINSWNLNDKQLVQIKVTGCSEDLSCGSWRFTLPSSVDALQGSCVDIPCTFTFPENAGDFNFFWYKIKSNDPVKIFNNKTPSDVHSMFDRRTFLTGQTRNNCSLRLINIEESDEGEYFPGINTDISSYKLQNKRLKVTVNVKPKPFILLEVTKELEEGKTVAQNCSVAFTCASEPPILTWSIPDHPITQEITYNKWSGEWTMVSIMTYTAIYTDDERRLQCKATFPNNKTWYSFRRLNIKYPPKNITVAVVLEGENVTLHCKSQANPPETTYTWYQVRPGGKLLQGDGAIITVRNSTNKQYICSARNEMGTEESAVFQLTGQSNEEESEMVTYVLIGIAAGLVLIFTLIILYFVITRMKITTSSNQGTNEKTEQDHIPLEHLYSNIDHNQQYKDPAEQSVTGLIDSSHIYDNADIKVSNISQTKPEESDGILYTLIELPQSSESLRQSRTIEMTQYATLKHGNESMDFS